MNIFSLAGTCTFKFSKPNSPELKLLVEPRSLLIFTKEAYTGYLHGIDFLDEDIVQLTTDEEGRILDSDLANASSVDLPGLCRLNETEAMHGSERFNRALVLKRGLRVSVTLRHVPPKR